MIASRKRLSSIKDFAFTAYADKECKQEIKSVHADVESGTATFDLRYGEYWIKETAAPKGYLLSDEVVERSLSMMRVSLRTGKN